MFGFIGRWIAEFRRLMNLPEWMMNLERVAEGSEAGRARVVAMRKNLSVMTNTDRPGSA